MPIVSVNPATGEKLKEFPAFSDSEIEKRLKLAERAFAHLRRGPFAKRSHLLMSTAGILVQET
jgi:succinate-semialdehyde dehydrogenase/glutarate-semialdehyde dehydrogenase